MSAAVTSLPSLHLIFSSIVPEALQLEQAVEQLLRSLQDHFGLANACCILFEETLQQGWKTLWIASEESGRFGRLPDGLVNELVELASPYVLLKGQLHPVPVDPEEPMPWMRSQVAAIGAPITLDQESFGLLHIQPFLPDFRPLSHDLEIVLHTTAFLARLMRLHSLAVQREQRLKRQNASLRYQVLKAEGELQFVGESRIAQELRRQASTVAPSTAPVLILGEHGVGKELLARIIHQISDRSHGPFVKATLEDLEEDHMLADIFGREGGSFPEPLGGAGFIEQAEGGVLYLEETHHLPSRLQARLLRLMQYGEFERLGSTTLRKADVRIIAGDSADLGELTTLGRFRPDLYYRLNVFPLEIPPLRLRMEDLEPLSAHFLHRAMRQYGRKLAFTPKALEVLRSHYWPGNVQELELLVDRLAILSDRASLDDRIVRQALQLGEREVEASLPPESSPSLKEMEKNEVVAALKRNQWIQHRAAKELHITARQMGYRIKKYGLGQLVAEQKRKCKTIKNGSRC
ncbi:MAG: sigma 54-interacting transcriptional regulator [Desulfovibrionaceae bacterium]